MMLFLCFIYVYIIKISSLDALIKENEHNYGNICMHFHWDYNLCERESEKMDSGVEKKCVYIRLRDCVLSAAQKTTLNFVCVQECVYA